ncbi:unnamed protein product, partial [Pelagomonas calceolata]
MPYSLTTREKHFTTKRIELALDRVQQRARRERAQHERRKPAHNQFGLELLARVLDGDADLTDNRAAIVGLLRDDTVEPLALGHRRVDVRVGAAQRALGFEGRPRLVGGDFIPVAVAHSFSLHQEAPVGLLVVRRPRQLDLVLRQDLGLQSQPREFRGGSVQDVDRTLLLLERDALPPFLVAAHRARRGDGVLVDLPDHPGRVGDALLVVEVRALLLRDFLRVRNDLGLLVVRELLAHLQRRRAAADASGRLPCRHGGGREGECDDFSLHIVPGVHRAAFMKGRELRMRFAECRVVQLYLSE